MGTCARHYAGNRPTFAAVIPPGGPDSPGSPLDRDAEYRDGFPPPQSAMHEHHAVVRWSRTGPDFLRGQYSRAHTWTFDGGVTVPASPSPSIVPAPWSQAAAVDPEEAFVAAVSSCHMLTFLWLASREGFQAESYEDEAVGRLTRNGRGALSISSVTLRPRVAWSGSPLPSPADLERLHHRAHEECFIANSVNSEIRVAPRP